MQHEEKSLFFCALSLRERGETGLEEMRNTKRGEIESVSDDRINHLTAKKDRENALEMDEVRQMLSFEYFKYFNSN